MSRGGSHSAPPGGGAGCTRRTFLLSALSGLTAAGVGTQGDLLAAVRPAPCPEPAWLAQLVPHREPAARIGRAYLEAYPGYRHCDLLLAEIEQTLKKHHAPEKLSPEITAATLQRVINREFAQDDVVSVDGWILSFTEARLYALVALNIKA